MMSSAKRDLEDGRDHRRQAAHVAPGVDVAQRVADGDAEQGQLAERIEPSPRRDPARR